MSAIVDFTNTGRPLQCWAPCHVGGGRNTAGDIAIHWTRRARINGAWLMGGGAVPLGEAVEKYKVILYSDNTYATAVTSYDAVDVTSITVSAADQVTNFGSLRSAGNCFVGIAQLGALGYGYEARAAL